MVDHPTPVDPRIISANARAEIAKLRIKGGESEHLALVVIGDQKAVAEHRQKMHDLMDVVLDSLTTAGDIIRQGYRS